jgi:hypothetical protein
MALFILALIIIASFILTGGFPIFQDSTTAQGTTNQTFVLVPDNPQPANQTLQLQTLEFTTPTPAPAPVVVPAAGTPGAPAAGAPPAAAPTGPPGCNFDTYTPMSPDCKCPLDVVTCANQQCTSIVNNLIGGVSVPCTGYDWCSFPGGPGETVRQAGTYCLGKPIIYLYPVKDTLVNVRLNIPGSIVESIPTYVSGGWTVLAHPNGNLEYLGKTYPELYYESSVTKVNPPQRGFVVEKSQAEVTLTEVTTKLGLIKSEQTEFLNYWLPKIAQLNAPYLFISVLDQKEKDRIDNVTISPKPETEIELLVYFKPVYAPYSPRELKLPNQPPKRNGFTSVEWGGTIDTTTSSLFNP